MTKKEFIKVVAEKMGATQVSVREGLDTILDTIAETLSTGETVDFKGFGKFTVYEKSESTARNPKTGEEFTVPAHNVCKFKASTALKDAVY